VTPAPRHATVSIAVERGGLGAVQAEHVEVHLGGIGAVRAQRVSVEFGGIGAALAREVVVNQGVVRGVLAGSTRIQQALVRTVVAGRVEMGPNATAGVVIAGRVDGNVRTLVDWRGALAIGGVLATFWAVRRLRR